MGDPQSQHWSEVFDLLLEFLTANRFSPGRKCRTEKDLKIDGDVPPTQGWEGAA
jgi:hypothetical protein